MRGRQEPPIFESHDDRDCNIELGPKRSVVMKNSTSVVEFVIWIHSGVWREVGWRPNGNANEPVLGPRAHWWRAEKHFCGVLKQLILWHFYLNKQDRWRPETKMLREWTHIVASCINYFCGVSMLTTFNHCDVHYFYGTGLLAFWRLSAWLAASNATRERHETHTIHVYSSMSYTDCGVLNVRILWCPQFGYTLVSVFVECSVLNVRMLWSPRTYTAASSMYESSGVLNKRIL